jgi:transaldolase / glucose-6-phosphate isomerase
MANPLRQPQACGQSVWLDFIERGFVQSGGLAKLIRDDGVNGLRWNAAYRDHGRPARQVDDPKSADVSIRDLARRLADAEIDLHAVAARLAAEGIERFIEPHEAILASLRTQIAPIEA